MKQLTCEMCGSTDLMKQDGVFVCQSCGMKYSVEEAKKMMIEGTVDVQGTVKVDNSAFVEKYLANARRAKEKEDWEEVEKYYNMVEQNDPNNIEAIFYSAYGKAKTSLTTDDIYKRQAVFKVLKNCISVLDDKYDIDREEENKEAIVSIAKDLGLMLCSSFVFTEWKDQYGNVTKTNKGETVSLFGDLLNAFRETMHNIEKVDDQPYLHEAAIALYQTAKQTNYWNAVQMVSWIKQEEEKLDRFSFELAKADPEVRQQLINKYTNRMNSLVLERRHGTVGPGLVLLFLGVAIIIVMCSCDIESLFVIGMGWFFGLFLPMTGIALVLTKTPSKDVIAANVAEKQRIEKLLNELNQ